MRETAHVERAASRAIARAKGRRDGEVTPDDLLVASLAEVSRFGIAWIGDWPIEIALLDGEPSASGGSREKGSAPAYSTATVRVFERAAAIAREDDSGRMALVHLFVALGEVECASMAELRGRYGFSPADWRAALAREQLSLSARLAGSADDGLSGGRGQGGVDPDIRSVDEAAEYLGVHAQTIRNYIRSGKLPAYRLAGERYIRVLRKDLVSLLERVRPEASEESRDAT